MTDKELDDVSAIRTHMKKKFSSDPGVQSLTADLEKSIDLIGNKKYRSIRTKFGKGALDAVMDYYLSKEDYNECINIRDYAKRKKK